ncbi:FG-GAP-like repeat-containing protein [Rubripirellula reticaptiva]|nr:FG-GAP-like repeat-containing protein [Rubripirellula reticaptiva]
MVPTPPQVPEAPAPMLARQQQVDNAVAAQGAGETDQAVRLLRDLLVRNPQDYEVLFHLANTLALQGKYDQGIELLSEIPTDHPDAGLPALGVSAGWCLNVGRYREAENRYRKMLEIDPTINLVRRSLAYLLNRQGRRHEANLLIRELCRSGDVMQDELHALIVEADAIYDAPGTPPADGTRPYWPIGPGGQARHLFTEKKYREAAELVRPVIELGEAADSMIAFYGRAAVEAQDDEMVAWWYGHLNESVKQFPEYWAAIGTQLIAEAEYADAVRALAEAVRLDPTDLRSTRRIFQGLRSMNETEKAQTWIDRYALLNQILNESNAIAASNAPATESFQALAKDLDSIGRRLEALLWQVVLVTRSGDSQDNLAGFKTDLQQTLADGTAFPEPSEIWCDMNLADRPLPPFPSRIAAIGDKNDSASKGFAKPTVPDPADFVNISNEVGLKHSYRIAKEPIAKGFAIYQSLGGGVAVTDFDLDGRPDLYFCQGAADPDNFVAIDSDRLYRTVERTDKNRTNDVQSNDQHLVDVTTPSGLNERSYTVGVTSGDWNQDGFADLAIANIGANQIMINQGDGTYRPEPLDEISDLTNLSTSLAMGDMTGDHLPDLFSLNYLRDENIAKLPTVDSAGDVVDAIAPLSVAPTRDILYANTGDGRWKASVVGDDVSNACTGLGIILTDLLSDHDGNEAYIANDVRNNQLWAQGEGHKLTDLAIASGCAYGSIGSATGAMGIASADLDRSGSVDLHVTNYMNEPVSLFLNRNGLFRDMNVKFGVDRESTEMVGFGTQAIDYSNDGWPDLVVTNGHIEDLRRRGNQPFQQPLQLFANLGDRFEITQPRDSEYWSTPRLGRAMARLDFNRDGRMDFAMTDLLGPASLLINQSPTNHHWVSFHLVGTTSERDAIGAHVEITAGDQQWSAWVTAGDGFLCKNESVVHFGIGAEARLDQATVTWPSGKIQTFNTLPADQSMLLVEGDAEPFALPRH